jgi:excisionase family DNA binding protein
VLSPTPKLSPAEKILLRLREAAELAAVSERFLWAVVARGELPTVRLSSRCVRIRRADLESWAAARASTRREPLPVVNGRRAAR